MKKKIDYGKVISELKERYSEKIDTIFIEKENNEHIIKIVCTSIDISDIPSEWMGVKIKISDKYEPVFD